MVVLFGEAVFFFGEVVFFLLLFGEVFLAVFFETFGDFCERTTGGVQQSLGCELSSRQMGSGRQRLAAGGGHGQPRSTGQEAWAAVRTFLVLGFFAAVIVVWGWVVLRLLKCCCAL
jgi:hypothetical protein